MLADAFVILVSLMLGAVALTQVLVPLIPLTNHCSSHWRKSYQRKKWVKKQLEETKRRLTKLELEKQLAEQSNELIRRQMEQMESCSSLASPPVEEDEPGVDRRRDISEKEH